MIPALAAGARRAAPQPMPGAPRLWVASGEGRKISPQVIYPRDYLIRAYVFVVALLALVARFCLFGVTAPMYTLYP